MTKGLEILYKVWMRVKCIVKPVPQSYGKLECQAHFLEWEILVSACDAIARDLEHFVFKLPYPAESLVKSSYLLLLTVLTANFFSLGKTHEKSIVGMKELQGGTI